MNLQPLQVDYHKARASLSNYLAIRKENRTAEDVAVIRSTKAILRGTRVIRLADAIKAGGVDSRGMPKLAVARADDAYVKCRSRGHWCEMVSADKKGDWISDYAKNRGSWHKRKHQVNPRGFDFNLAGAFVQTVEGEAMVPTIPPQHRVPANAAERFYVLFEAEWKHVPPTDPALLSPLGGGLFAVVAVWDLTDVERAVLATMRGV